MNCNFRTKNRLIVIAGATAVGKTAFCVQLAKRLNAPVINADSRQFYFQTVIGTAAPTKEEMQGVPHYLVGHLSIEDYYNVFLFEQDVLRLLNNFFLENPYVILTGGSGMYLDTICNGIDDLPDIDPILRQELINKYQTEGLQPLLDELQMLDPEHFRKVDKHNHQRILRALEVCRQTGQTYTSLRIKKKVRRNFDVIKICLTLPREVLCERINKRTLIMMENGFLEEAKSLFPYRHFNALNTVGYKELFAHFAGEYDLKTAVVKIQTQTRRYAKRQMTWFKRDPNYLFIEPAALNEVIRSCL